MSRRYNWSIIQHMWGKNEMMQNCGSKFHGQTTGDPEVYGI